MFEIDDSAGFRGCGDEFRLHAEVCRYLQYVHDLRCRCRLLRIMDVGQDRQSDLILDASKDAQAFLEARSLEIVERASIVLGERRLEDERQIELLADGLEALCRLHHHRFFLDDTRPANQEQVVRSAVDAGYVYVFDSIHGLLLFLEFPNGVS